MIVAALVTVCTSAVTSWLLARDARGAEIANVLALGISIVGVMVTILAALRTPLRAHASDVSAQALRELVGLVAEQERGALQRLLADGGDLPPADVPFVRGTKAILARSDGGASAGALSSVGSYYSSLKRGRMVILGEPGSGKTVLASQLILDLIKDIPEVRMDGCVRVPVRFSLPTFVPELGKPLTAQSLKGQLDDWLVGQLAGVSGLRKSIARDLLRRGRVLTVLDGLDEMDPDGVTPVRARAVLSALSYPTGEGLQPVVITCREQSYLRLSASTRGASGVLQDATVVVLQPLSVDQVAEWVSVRFPDGDSGRAHPRWSPVLKEMRKHRQGSLAKSLSSPLMLFLVVTVYQHPDSSPRELLDVPARGLRDHLLTRLIPAVIEQYPRLDGYRHQADEVSAFLSTMAMHLKKQGQNGGSATDLHLADSWKISPRHLMIRAVARLFAAVPITVPAVFLGVVSLIAFGHVWRLTTAFDWIFVALVTTLPVGVIVVAVSNATADRSEMRRWSWSHLRTSSGRIRFLVWFLGAVMLAVPGLISLAVVLNLDLVTWRARGTSVGVEIALGLLCGIAVALVIGALGGVGSTAFPGRIGRILRDSVRYDLAVIGWATIAAAGAVCLVGGPYAAPAGGFLGFTGGLYARLGSFLPYDAAIRLLYLFGLISVQPLRLLDWAHDSGLLRITGLAVQFRHLELQHWLAPPSGQPGRR